MLIVIISVAILILLIIWVSAVYNKYQTYIIRINEAENFIDNTLRKRYDLLNKAISIIKSHVSKKETVLECIENIKSKKLSNFELDRKLYDGINEFNKYKEDNEELSNSEEFIKIDLSLYESEAEIVAARKYYNDIITEYNKQISRFPNNIVSKIMKFKKKTYYDGKNLEKDDSIKGI